MIKLNSTIGILVYFWAIIGVLALILFFFPQAYDVIKWIGLGALVTAFVHYSVLNWSWI